MLLPEEDCELEAEADEVGLCVSPVALDEYVADDEDTLVLLPEEDCEL